MTSPFAARVPVNAAGGAYGNWARPGSSGDRASRGRSANVPRMGLGRGAPACRGGSVWDGCGGAGDPYSVVVGGHVDKQSAGPAHILALQHGDLCWGVD